MDTRKELDELILTYHQDSEHEIFLDFAEHLVTYKNYIISSFVMVEKHGFGKVYKNRPSNCPIE